MNQISWLLFDLGGVLLRVEQSRIFEELAKLTQRTPDVIKSALVSAEPFWSDFVVREYSPAELAEQVNSLLATRLSISEVEAAFNSELGEPITSSLELLPILRQRVNIGCLSNTNSIHWDCMLQEYEMMRHFDRRFASQFLGHAKPAAEIYKKVVEHLGVMPNQILFFDDRSENIAAASRLGWNASLYHSHADLLSVLREFKLID
jgi:HAD superfamily hydrolase (TIGR01509 family)